MTPALALTRLFPRQTSTRFIVSCLKKAMPLFARTSKKCMGIADAGA